MRSRGARQRVQPRVLGCRVVLRVKRLHVGPALLGCLEGCCKRGHRLEGPCLLPCPVLLLLLCSNPAVISSRPSMACLQPLKQRVTPAGRSMPSLSPSAAPAPAHQPSNLLTAAGRRWPAFDAAMLQHAQDTDWKVHAFSPAQYRSCTAVQLGVSSWREKACPQTLQQRTRLAGRCTASASPIESC